MAFERTAGLKGSARKYQLHPEVKRYTLRDTGFTETKNGNFQLIRPLDTSVQHKQGVVLKIMVAKELDSLKITTTTANGLKEVDVYASEKMAALRNNLEFILNYLEESRVLAAV